MGMLTSWLTAVGKQNPSSRSLLEALTGEEGDDLDQLKRMLAKAKLSQLLSESKLLETPTWTNIPPRAEYDPASEGLFPGKQQQIKVGEKYYRVPAGRPREQMVGPTFGEAGALSEIYKNLPLKELISSKAGPGMFQPFLQRFMGPEAAETMTGGTMFPTEETRTFEQYLPKFLELMEITKKPREGTRAERAPEVKEEEPEAAPSEVHKIVPIAKMLMDEMRRIYGTLEQEKGSKITTFGPEQGVMVGEKVVRQPGEKPRTGILGEFDEWVKTNPGKNLGDYIVWKADAMANAKIRALQSRAQSDPDAKKAFDIAKYAVNTYLEQNPIAAMDMDMDQISDMFLDRYNHALNRIKGKTKAPGKDVLGIQQRLDLKMKELGEK